MSLLLISGIAGLGYFLNRNGRASRIAPENMKLPARDQPSGMNIYATDRTHEINEVARQVGSSHYPHKVSYGPNAAAHFQDRQQIAPPISQLSGLPMQMFHNNMHPGFGGVKKQDVIGDHARMFEAYGITDETPARKGERWSDPLKPQELKKIVASDDPTWVDRVANDLTVTRPDVRLPQMRETLAPIGPELRILPQTGDDVRPLNRPMQAEYQNELRSSNKLGDAPPLPGILLDKKHDIDQRSTRLGNASSSLPPFERLSQHMVLNEDKVREASKNTYLGPAISSLPSHALDEAQRSAAVATFRERPEIYRDRAAHLGDGVRLPVLKGAQGTTFIAQNSKHDRANSRVPTLSSHVKMEALEGIMEVDMTSKESLVNRSSFIGNNPKLPNSMQQPAKINFNLRTTAREINGNTMHFGPAHTGLNLPATVQEYDLNVPSHAHFEQDRPRFGNATSAHHLGAEVGEFTESEFTNREMTNGAPSGAFLPLGTSMAPTEAYLRPETDKRVNELTGRFNTALGSGKRLDFAAKLKKDQAPIEPSQTARIVPSFQPPACYPVITKAREREAQNDRILLPHPDMKAAVEYGRLPSEPLH